MPVYAVMNEKGLDVAHDNRRFNPNLELLGQYQYPFEFDEIPDKDFLMGNARGLVRVPMKPEHFTFYNSNALPKLLKKSFELLAEEFKYRSTSEWFNDAKPFLTILKTMGSAEPEVLLINTDSGSFSWFLNTDKFVLSKLTDNRVLMDKLNKQRSR